MSNGGLVHRNNFVVICALFLSFFHSTLLLCVSALLWIIIIIIIHFSSLSFYVLLSSLFFFIILSAGLVLIREMNRMTILRQNCKISCLNKIQFCFLIFILTPKTITCEFFDLQKATSLNQTLD